jgi:hypothetical protein
MAVRGQNYPDDGESRDGDWFARQLGDGWKPSGEGIYEYVGERLATDDVRSVEPDAVDEIAPKREQPEDEHDAPGNHSSISAKDAFE